MAFGIRQRNEGMIPTSDGDEMSGGWSTFLRGLAVDYRQYLQDVLQNPREPSSFLSQAGLQG